MRTIFELRQWDAQVPNQIFAGVGDAGDDIPFGEMGWPGGWEINCVKLCKNRQRGTGELNVTKS